MQRFRVFYNRVLQRHPLLTNAVTGSFLWAAGDVLCQQVEDRTKPWDPMRTLRIGGFGALAGPMYATWYTFLDRLMLRRALSPLRTVGEKVLMDLFVFEPPMLLFTFWALGKMEGKPDEEITAKIKEDYLHTFAADCGFWAPSQMFNFYFVPTRHQALYVNTLSIVWNGYLSYVTQNDWKEEQKRQQEQAQQQQQQQQQPAEATDSSVPTVLVGDAAALLRAAAVDKHSVALLRTEDERPRQEEGEQELEMG